MCKIATFTNATNLNIVEASEAIGKIMLGLERDGFGYAVQGAENVFGERCVASKFKSRLKGHNIINLPIVEPRHAVFGQADKPVGPAIFHGRTSTNDKGLKNCHPMSRDNWHLVHNGVVTDHGPKYSKFTTNDSEDVVHRLTLGIEHVERDLSGYYAFCAIAPDGKLHVARDSQATLYIAECPKLQSYLIATTESLIESIAKALKIKIGPIDKIKSNVYMIFDGNDLIFERAINPRGFEYNEARYAELSLGRRLDVSGSSYESTLDAIDSIGNRAEYDEAREDELTELMRELDNIDESYLIEDEQGNMLTVHEYRKLDEVAKRACYIERADGTPLYFEDEYFGT